MKSNVPNPDTQTDDKDDHHKVETHVLAKVGQPFSIFVGHLSAR